jgi:copper chaperone NosL
MKKLIYSIILFVLVGCNVQPEEINYGADACHYCQMNIVDGRYAAEIVTAKGKVHKFDAVECMINYINKNNLNKEELAFIMVNSFSDPVNLHPADKSYFLRSSSLPSPMGMYITPFESKDSAEFYQHTHSGEIFNWEQLNNDFHSLTNLGE